MARLEGDSAHRLTPKKDAANRDRAFDRSLRAARIEPD